MNFYTKSPFLYCILFGTKMQYVLLFKVYIHTVYEDGTFHGMLLLCCTTPCLSQLVRSKL